MSEAPNRAFKDQYMLRMPEGLRDRIAEVAKRNGRSMNAELVQRLEEAYPPPRQHGDIVDRMRVLAMDLAYAHTEEAQRQLYAELSRLADDLKALTGR